MKLAYKSAVGLMLSALVICAALVATTQAAFAQRVSNKVAVFAALDKVTATIKQLEVPLGETQEFGSLRITPRVCYSRPATEKPKTTTFVEVEELQLEGEKKRLFTGWMFAESPGLNAVEHPVFDVWLTGCAEPDAAASAAAAVKTDEDGNVIETEELQPPPRRRRVRR